MSKDITARLKTVYTQREELKALSRKVSSSATKDGLDNFEEAAISLIFEEHFEGEITPWTLRQNMEKSGFTKAASTLAALNLIKRGFIQKELTHNYNSDEYPILTMTESGIDWVREHSDSLILTTHQTARSRAFDDQIITDDDIPF